MTWRESSFSRRHGYGQDDIEITIREDAPDVTRPAIPIIAEESGMTPSVIRSIIVRVLLVRPDPSNWSEYPNVWDDVLSLITDCFWNRVYDIAELIHASFAPGYPERARGFEDRLNQCFWENSIVWEMQNGKVIFRDEALSDATKNAVASLEHAVRERAANEIREALRDISRRPEPDLTGSIQHSIAALESTARDVTGKPNRTLGQLVPHLELPVPRNTAVDKLWAYASDRARHVREGLTVDPSEAVLIVSVACAVCTFLSQRD